MHTARKRLCGHGNGRQQKKRPEAAHMAATPPSHHQRGRQSQRSHHEASSLSFAGVHTIVSADAVTFCITSLSQALVRALQKQRFIYNILSMILKFVWALGGSCCLSDLHGISPLDIHLISVFNRGAYRSLHPDSQPHGPGNTCLGHQFSTSPRRRPKSDAK